MPGSHDSSSGVTPASEENGGYAFLVLLRDADDASGLARLLEDVRLPDAATPSVFVAPPVSGVDFFADESRQADVDEWWANHIPRNAVPVYLFMNEAGLNDWVRDADGIVYVGVADTAAIAEFSGDRIRAFVAGGPLDFATVVMRDFSTQSDQPGNVGAGDEAGDGSGDGSGSGAGDGSQHPAIFDAGEARRMAALSSDFPIDLDDSSFPAPPPFTGPRDDPLGVDTTSPPPFSPLPSSPFGAPGSMPSPFGSPPSPFGAPGYPPSPFGAPGSAPSPFGPPAADPAPAWGAPATPTPPPWSAPSAMPPPASPWGAPAPPPWGPPTTPAPPWGVPAATPAPPWGTPQVAQPQTRPRMSNQAATTAHPFDLLSGIPDAPAPATPGAAGNQPDSSAASSVNGIPPPAEADTAASEGAPPPAPVPKRVWDPDAMRGSSGPSAPGTSSRAARPQSTRTSAGRGSKVSRITMPPLAWPRRGGARSNFSETPNRDFAALLLERGPTIVVMGSRKGGVGKTSYAAGVAIVAGTVLDTVGHKAAIVDANIANPDAWGQMNLREGAATVREVVAALTANQDPPPPVHATTPALACYPESRETTEYSKTDVKRFAEYLRRRYTFIVVDMSNRLPDPMAGPEAAAAAYWLEHADVLVLPTTSSKQDFNGVLDYLEVRDLPPTVVPYIVPGVRKNREHPVTQQYLSVIRDRVHRIIEIPDEADKVRYAGMEGVPVEQVSPSLRAAYRELTEVIARVPSRPRN